MLWELGLPGFTDVVDQLPRHRSKRYEQRTPAEIQYLIVHHTAGPQDQSLWEIARFHVQERDWPGIGYHLVVDARGQAFKTNRDLTVSYHAGQLNRAALGLCLVGNLDEHPPTPEQYRAALWHALRYARAYGIPVERVRGHREVAQTACPGRHLDLDRFRQDLATLLRLELP